VLVLADVEKKLLEGDWSPVDLMVRAKIPGSYSDVIVKAFSLYVLDDGDRKSCWQCVERGWKLVEMRGGALALT
jgi:hypothetical protein